MTPDEIDTMLVLITISAVIFLAWGAVSICLPPSRDA